MKKIFSVLLCIFLLSTIAVNVAADGETLSSVLFMSDYQFIKNKTPELFGDNSITSCMPVVDKLTKTAYNIGHNVETVVVGGDYTANDGARDKNGIKRTLREGYKIGFLVTVGCCVLLVVLLPLLQQFYGMPGDINIKKGVCICFLFMPVILAIRLMTQFFESTEKAGMGIIYSVAPDSVIYPIILVPLLSRLGYTGIWLAYGCNYIIFLVLLFLFRSIKNKSFTFSIDRLLCLEENIRDNVPMLDISINSDNKTAAGVSERVQAFLSGEGLSEELAYKTALCLEEITADFVEHTCLETGKTDTKEIMDMKIFSDSDGMRIMIRNAAEPYNPLDFECSEDALEKIGIKMVQKMSKSIDYSYAYKMNIITIDLDK